MDRVVYTPKGDVNEMALCLSRMWSLPIQEGNSERTKDLKFDRDKTFVLAIPINKQLTFESYLYKVNSNINIHYVNDFIDCQKLELFIYNKNYNKTYAPLYTGKHIVEWKIRVPVSGEFVVQILDNKVSVEESELIITEEASW